LQTVIVKVLFVFAFFVSARAVAAPCCAGSTALPSLITGDEARNFSIAISYSAVVADAFGALDGRLPEFRDDRSSNELRQNANFNFATLLSDRFQIGFSVPIVHNQIKAGSRSEAKTLFGDVSMTFGYEALPEYEYTEWIPRVYFFFQAVLPTGHSVQVSDSPLGTDVAGLGQWQTHFGSVAIKRWSDWDAMIVGKVGRLYSQIFESSSNGITRVGASWGLTASLGAGYSFAEFFRVGASLEPQYQSPQEVATSGFSSSTSQKLVWNTGLTATALVGANSSLVVGYVDQTLVGPAINTTMARTLSLSFQLRFDR
jgi:hypothetical protein